MSFHLDGLHVVFANIYLIFYMCRNRTCKGISGKTQILYSIVATIRAIELLAGLGFVFETPFVVAYLLVTDITVALIYHAFRSTYSAAEDDFPIAFILLPVAMIPLIIAFRPVVFQSFWVLSMFLEPLAILPQMFFISKTWKAEPAVLFYMFLLMVYSTAYAIINWICVPVHVDYLLVCDVYGPIQALVHYIFFSLYIMKSRPPATAILPVMMSNVDKKKKKKATNALVKDKSVKLKEICVFPLPAPNACVHLPLQASQLERDLMGRLETTPDKWIHIEADPTKPERY